MLDVTTKPYGFADWISHQEAGEISFFSYIDYLNSYQSGVSKRLSPKTINWQAASRWALEHQQTIVNYPSTEDGCILIYEAAVLFIGGWGNPGDIYYAIKWNSWKPWLRLGTQRDINRANFKNAPAMNTATSSFTYVFNTDGNYHRELWISFGVNTTASFNTNGTINLFIFGRYCSYYCCFPYRQNYGFDVQEGIKTLLNPAFSDDYLFERSDDKVYMKIYQNPEDEGAHFHSYDGLFIFGYSSAIGVPTFTVYTPPTE